MKRWLREPLVHFVLLGAGLFALDAALSGRAVEARDDRIVVSAGRIENLATLFAKTWQRPPTADELRGLVDDYVLEEALYREGMALGLATDDTIIRRRVRQKMEFVVDDVVEQADPGDAELAAWLAAHPDSYARPARVSFRQVVLSPDRRGDALRADAEELLATLRSGTDGVDVRELGDASLLEHAYRDTEVDRVARDFGRAFADALAELPEGEWGGPVPSPYGLHLVLVDSRSEGRLPALDEVRDAVARDWSYAQREQASKRFHQELLARYRVSVDWPGVVEADAADSDPSLSRAPSPSPSTSPSTSTD